MLETFSFDLVWRLVQRQQKDFMAPGETAQNIIGSPRLTVLDRVRTAVCKKQDSKPPRIFPVKPPYAVRHLINATPEKRVKSLFS
jgi:hypothetical protein